MQNFCIVINVFIGGKMLFFIDLLNDRQDIKRNQFLQSIFNRWNVKVFILNNELFNRELYFFWVN